MGIYTTENYGRYMVDNEAWWHNRRRTHPTTPQPKLEDYLTAEELEQHNQQTKRTNETRLYEMEDEILKVKARAFKAYQAKDYELATMLVELERTKTDKLKNLIKNKETK